MNRIAISITMLIPPLFLLSLAVAQPVSAAPPDGEVAAAVPWGPPTDAVGRTSEVVFGECTGSACSAPRSGDGSVRVPDPLRFAPLVVNVTPNGLRADVAVTALPSEIARSAGTGSASSLPRIVHDLLLRLLDLVKRTPLPLSR
ncbi:hypothetical protein OG874_23840 [Nocardia sp. NBC_00565]|uniref:hypothetical protein n=1 Tax=Nocardia sp. NBC_00565 TaxID=2975993 RepID=UPI002E821BA9|nr:hypothetical protein [Nocardia sp. NBC_00565]WUB99948.1 hypothetical protein OG874_23840 [Nocardia sp. NBC_00565]